jgi:hypothetical protein
MSLVDVYVSEVGRNLPAKMREDIEKETRSLIEDMLDDAAKAQARQPDEQMIVDVLKQMGSPEKVAASYLPPRYLIGPKYYSTFMMVLRIVLTVVLVVGAIGLGVELGRSGSGSVSFGSTLANGFAGLLGSLIAAFGNVVLIFAILQWLLPEPKFDQKEWDPRALKAEPDPERVKTFDMVAGMVGNMILLLLLNVYPHWLGIFNYENGVWVRARVLTDAFYTYIPWMSLVLAAGIALNAYLLRQGRWNTAARLASVAISVGSIILLGTMISGPALVGFDPADFARLGWTEALGNIGRWNDGLNLLMRMALGIALVAQVIDMAKMLLRLIGSRVSLPGELSK